MKGRASAGPAIVIRSTAVLVCTALLALPSTTRAQLAEPCGVGCAVGLAGTSFVFATGVTTLVGRERGGFERASQASILWAGSFAVGVGAGVALHGDGERQRRAVAGAALGAAGGALGGLALESLVGESTPASRLAATLVGGAVGVVVGGALGAWTRPDATAEPTPLFVTRITW